jgi:hypothetical protein
MRDDLSLRTRSIGPSWPRCDTAADVKFVSRSAPAGYPNRPGTDRVYVGVRCGCPTSLGGGNRPALISRWVVVLLRPVHCFTAGKRRYESSLGELRVMLGPCARTRERAARKGDSFRGVRDRSGRRYPKAANQLGRLSALMTFPPRGLDSTLPLWAVEDQEPNWQWRINRTSTS